MTTIFNRKKGSEMSRMDKKDKMQKEAELEAREEALEEEALPVEDAADASQAPKGPTQEELDAAKAKADEYLTLAQRVQADFDNFRRRNESVRADAYNEGVRALAATLLPVMDNLERAVDAAKDSPDAQLKEGVGQDPSSGWCPRPRQSSRCNRTYPPESSRRCPAPRWPSES